MTNSEVFRRRYSQIYEALYLARGRDFAKEAAEAHGVIQDYGKSSGQKLLDVACGTGAHLVELERWYEVEGLDASPDMLEIAAERLPGMRLHQADMTDFDLGRRFDAITCFFSSIAYVKTLERLDETIRNFCRHLEPGGVMLIEPWYTPETFLEDSLHLAQVDEPDRKVVRINLSKREGGCSVAYFHYMVADSNGVDYFTERHELGLFSGAEIARVWAANSLELSYEADVVSDQGLYVGQLPI